MRLVLFQTTGASDVRPGLLTERGVVSIADLVPAGLPHVPLAVEVDAHGKEHGECRDDNDADDRQDDFCAFGHVALVSAQRRARPTASTVITPRR